MKFAFSTVSCPAWDFDTIVARASEYGYDGVELRAFLNESILTAANPFHTDPAKVRDLFARHSLQICCLSSSIEMTQNKRKDARLLQDLARYIDTARELHCPFVRVFDTRVKPGWDRGSIGVVLGDWLLPMADYAADRDVTIVIENALSFRSAKEMWGILDRLSHPSIACCWDVFNAALVGETPYLSVPTLNSRIAYAQVKDAKLGALGATYCKLGEGDVPIEKFLIRLRGIGYTGWVTVEWEKAWLPNLAEPEEILPDAIKKLRQWTGQNVDIPGVESDSEPAAATHGAVVK
jgi:sugar phosphate isomerase/epimerase